MEKQGLRIIRLQAENFKKLTAIEISPDGNIITITGKNDAGKTSVLDAISAALGGEKLCPVQPIRKGELKATIICDLGEFLVTRHFTEKGSYLKVETDGGLRFSTPQKVLDGIVGQLSFDPAQFMNEPPRRKREILLSMIDLKPDWSKYPDDGIADLQEGDVLENIDESRARVFDLRKDQNAEVKRLQGTIQTEEKKLPAENMRGTKLIDTAEFTRQLKDAVRESKEVAQIELQIEKETAQNKARGSDIAIWEEKIEEIKEKIKRLQGDREKTTESIETKTAELEIRKQNLTDIDKIEASLNEANAYNQRATQIAEVLRQIEGYRKNLELAQNKAGELTTRLQKIDQFKIELLADAEFPVPGLGITSDGLTFDGFVLEQASHAAKLRVSMAIAMKLNPKLRVIRITEGEKFDSGSWKIIEEMAGDNDFQIWIEKMDESGKIGIVIEDGAIQAK